MGREERRGLGDSVLANAVRGWRRDAATGGLIGIAIQAALWWWDLLGPKPVINSDQQPDAWRLASSVAALVTPGQIPSWLIKCFNRHWSPERSGEAAIVVDIVATLGLTIVLYALTGVAAGGRVSRPSAWRIGVGALWAAWLVATITYCLTGYPFEMRANQ